MSELVSFLSELSDEYGLPVPAFGHAGDGNIHVNIMLDKNDSLEMEKAEKIVRALFKRVMELEGTISGEHGIGITKAPYMGIEFSKPAIEIMRRIKDSFDPNNILNPGKIFTDN
jgi:glycolate oxidase